MKNLRTARLGYKFTCSYKKKCMIIAQLSLVYFTKDHYSWQRHNQFPQTEKKGKIYWNNDFTNAVSLTLILRKYQMFWYLFFRIFHNFWIILKKGGEDLNPVLLLLENSFFTSRLEIICSKNFFWLIVKSTDAFQLCYLLFLRQSCGRLL